MLSAVATTGRTMQTSTMLRQALAPNLRTLISAVRVVRGAATARVGSVKETVPAAEPRAKPPGREVVVPADKTKISPVRGLFFGDLSSFQRNCLPYPQALSPEQKDTLRTMVDPVERFMASVPSSDIDRKHSIPPEVLDGLRSLGLFGLQIPEEYGGLGLSNTANARVVEEFWADASIAVTLMAHQVRPHYCAASSACVQQRCAERLWATASASMRRGVLVALAAIGSYVPCPLCYCYYLLVYARLQSIGLKGILLFGTPEQKARYLPKLASGEHIAAFALTEPTAGSDAAGIKLQATPTPDGKGYELNGSKMWISNGSIAQIYTVFARTPDSTAPGGSKVTAFIVDRDFGGVNPGPPEVGDVGSY